MRLYLIFLLLFLLLGPSVSAQQNEYQDSRSFIGVSAGTLTGIDGRLYINDHWFSCFHAGYFGEKETLGGSISLGYAWTVGLFQRNQVYTSLGYLSSTDINFITPVAKLGYRLQFGQSPLFLHTEWKPWLDQGAVFRPLAGQVALSYAFKRSSRRNKREAMNGFYNTAVGIKIGSLLGFSMRTFTTPRGAIQLELDYDPIKTASSFSVTYGYNQPIGQIGIFTYANLGGGYQVSQRRDINGERFAELDGFLAFIAGIEYNIFALPLQVGVQWEPRYGLEQGLRLELGSFVLRYIF